ncbi:MAG TPA: hypothetical protein PKK18_12250 [Chitinophagales bacterium]|nr:hypothetical protein [Chitinophagales bacterium]HMZ34648.1 hypothetical protein [Chitinophagales bacterium]HNF51576.1 hypothetical protein [Chitinophagales bacterium]HNG71868.1 hypothetical protein [Chitinophagales bacterium]HNN27203.1 hypothetical protein [Chitinophagales bacterium]
MEKQNIQHLYFYLAVLCALWFASTSWIWTYLFALFISYPIGLLAFIFWYRGSNIDENKNRYNLPKYILIFGLLSSIISFLLML